MRLVWVALICLVPAAMAQLRLQSEAFENYSKLPAAFVCDPVERDSFRPSVPLSWMRAPAKVQSFVLMMDDNSTGAVHWLVKDIPRTVDNIEFDATETNMPAGSVELPNSFGSESYVGPCPTQGTHYFRFRLFAMAKTHTAINSTSGKSDDVVAQIEASVLYTASLIGTVEASHPTNTTKARHQAMVMLKSNQTWPTNSTRKPIVPKKTSPSRFPKPSEVLRPGVALHALNPCEGVQAVKLQECLTNLEQTSSSNNSDVWGCAGLKGSHAGVRYLPDGQIERCPMQIRVGGVSCDHQKYPVESTCHTQDAVHPELLWRGVPEHTLSFVVMIDDLSQSSTHPDETGNVYWLVSSIPQTANGISHNAMLPPLSVEMKNSFDHVGYTPPCPQAGGRSHNYRVKLFAMPHVSSAAFISLRYSAEKIARELQKYALCIASHELSFT